jgi:hypothetical protein
MIYSLRVNEADLSHLAYDIEKIEEKKEWRDKIVKQEFSITLSYKESLNPFSKISVFSSIDYRDVPVILCEKYTGDVVIKGVITDIKPKEDKIELLVSTANREKLNDNLAASHYYKNPADIFKSICAEKNIPLNNLSYKRVKSKYKNTSFSVIADELSAYDALDKLSKLSAISAYFSGGELVLEALDTAERNSVSFTLTDKNISKVSYTTNREKERFYTNYLFTCEDTVDVEYKDADGTNYASSLRKKFGDIPYDDLEGNSDNPVRIKDTATGHFAGLQYLKYYSCEFVILELELDIKKFNAIRLDTVFSFNSVRFNFDKNFEVKSLSRDFAGGIIKIEAWELSQNSNLSLKSGFGVTPYFENYGL